MSGGNSCHRCVLLALDVVSPRCTNLGLLGGAADMPRTRRERVDPTGLPLSRHRAGQLPIGLVRWPPSNASATMERHSVLPAAPVRRSLRDGGRPSGEVTSVQFLQVARPTACSRTNTRLAQACLRVASRPIGSGAAADLADTITPRDARCSAGPPGRQERTTGGITYDQA